MANNSIGSTCTINEFIRRWINREKGLFRYTV